MASDFRNAFTLEVNEVQCVLLDMIVSRSFDESTRRQPLLLAGPLALR